MEFESSRSYWEFRREVIRDWRYLRSTKAQSFLDAVKTTCHDRSAIVPVGRHLYRAQVAHHDDFDPEVDDSFPGPARPERINPLRDRAKEGRINPKGIPCLYMASDKPTAIAETRPWIGSLVSLGTFQTEKILKVVDCTRETHRNRIYPFDERDAEERNNVVWSHIAHAFREPVTRDDDIAEYAPTQIIAEIFRAEGYDGVAYRSGFGTDRYNIGLFDLDAARLRQCELFEIRDVELKCEVTANPYIVQALEDGNPTHVRNTITDFQPIELVMRDEGIDED